MALGKSETKVEIIRDWKKIDCREARAMHLEAVAGASVLDLLLALA